MGSSAMLNKLVGLEGGWGRMKEFLPRRFPEKLVVLLLGPALGVAVALFETFLFLWAVALAWSDMTKLGLIMVNPILDALGL
jgi:hypothetical protein